VPPITSKRQSLKVVAVAAALPSVVTILVITHSEHPNEPAATITTVPDQRKRERRPNHDDPDRSQSCRGAALNG
jgi:hypothetical protein